MTTMVQEIARRVLEDHRTRLKLEPGDDTETYWKGRVDAGLDLLKLIPGGIEAIADEIAGTGPRDDDVMPA